MNPLGLGRGSSPDFAKRARQVVFFLASPFITGSHDISFLARPWNKVAPEGRPTLGTVHSAYCCAWKCYLVGKPGEPGWCVWGAGKHPRGSTAHPSQPLGPPCQVGVGVRKPVARSEQAVIVPRGESITVMLPCGAPTSQPFL